MNRVAILTDIPQNGPTYQTEYGETAPVAETRLGRHTALICAAAHADPRATVRALRDLGATHLWLCESVAALSRLLDSGDVLIPDDYIDGTRGYTYTTYTETAGGYVQQIPAFDPASRDALIQGARAISPRPFTRGVYVCVSPTRLETPAEAAFWARAGAHVAGRFLSPWLTLARELDMHVAVLALVVRDGGQPGQTSSFTTYAPALTAALDALPLPMDQAHG
ncbi:MAG: hypothetical protein DIU68_010090 [Chloroflexota bacterium]|nr:MAG: hypothetical protein DIU68_02770 [Chloroflexota bacterium]